MTILAWCLVRSHEVFHAMGQRALATRDDQRERYGWLQPLELMWVARTIMLAVRPLTRGPDDWDVIHEARVIGRIFNARAGGFPRINPGSQRSPTLS